MAGIGPLGAPVPPRSLSKADKDGGGSSGGRYLPGRRNQQEPEHHEDHADLSESAKEQLSHIRQQDPSVAEPDSANAQLHILAEIAHFNETHERLGSRLKAVLKPLGAAAAPTGAYGPRVGKPANTPAGQKLVIEDPVQGVTIQPFGDTDIFYQSPQTVRTRLESFDRSSGSLFDGKV
jgi:hypothetical protein